MTTASFSPALDGTATCAASASPIAAGARHAGIAYRADIDGLRAVAIAAVLVFHAFPELLPGGFIGVDVFFAISGFLIASIVLREAEQGVFSIGGFYRRRVRRIFPALIVVLATCLAAGAVGLFDVEYLRLATHALYGAFGLANLSLYRDTGYFALSAESNPLLHLWSLGVEEQFYVLLPLAMLLCGRPGRRLAALLLALFAASLWLAVDFPIQYSVESKFYLPQFRGWELMAGVLLAYAMRSALVGAEAHGPKEQRARNVLSVLGAACVVAGLVDLSSASQTVVAGTVGIGGALMLIAAGPGAWINRHVLASRWMVRLGVISYPLYLWHWPVISFARIVHPELARPALVGLLGLSVLLAALTWRYVEKPARTAAAAAKAPWLLLALMAAIAVAAAGIVQAEGRIGWAARTDTLAFQNSDRPPDPRCEQRYWGDAPHDEVYTDCTNSGSDREAPVVLVGDSHALQLFSGMADYYGRRKQDVLSLSTTGCPLFDEPPASPRCQWAYGRIFERLRTLKGVKTVVLSEYYAPAESHKQARPHWTGELRALARRLTAEGKRVVVMLDIPAFDVEPRERCYQRPLGLGWDPHAADRCSIPRSGYLAGVAEYRPNAAAAVQGLPGVVVFDLAATLCDRTTCHGAVDGRVIYRDHNHLNYHGSMYVARFYDWEPPAADAPRTSTSGRAHIPAPHPTLRNPNTSRSLARPRYGSEAIAASP